MPRNRLDSRLRWLCWSIAGACVVRFGYLMSQRELSPIDDAYMFIRYANNLLAGSGLAWNPDGGQVFGTTNLLYTLAVTLFKAVAPLRDEALLIACSAITGMAALIALVAVASRIARAPSLHRNYALWFAVMLALLLPGETFLYHVQSGMGTLLSMLCNTLLILACWRLVTAPRVAALALVLAASYATYLARPDNGLYAVVFPALCITLLVSGPQRWRWLGMFSLGMFSLLAADALLKWGILGDPVPLSFYAKQSGYYLAYTGAELWNPFAFLSEFVWNCAPFLAVLILGTTRRELRMLTAFSVPVLLTVAYFFTVNQVMGFHARFYYPALPFVALSAVLVLDARVRTGDLIATSRRALVPRLTALVVLAGLAPGLDAASEWYGPRFLRLEDSPPALEYATRAVYPLPELGWDTIVTELSAIVGAAPAGTSVALSEHGQIGAAAPHVILIDVVGLHDPEFAHHGFSAQALFERKPDMVWLPHPDYVGMVNAIGANETFMRDYDFFVGAFDYGLALLKSSERHDELLRLVQASWNRSYGNVPMSRHLALASSE